MATATAPGTLSANFRTPSSIPQTTINEAAATLPAAAGGSYLKVWVEDNATGEVQTLALLKWAPPQALPTIQAPATASTVKFELYNEAGSVLGQWSVQ